jgi:ureidoglycolate dehydrogenase (NAD+)
MSQESTQRVPEARLRRFTECVLGAMGVPAADAAVVADCLLVANLSGVDSHGVVRLAHYVTRLENGTLDSLPDIVFRRSGPSAGMLDGGDGLGHVVMLRACVEAMAMARESGVGVVGVANSSHFGMTAFYIQRLVSEGFIGLAMTDTDAFLIPFGGRKAFFGTNPIAIGFPTQGIPVILDMATTSIPYGKIALAKAEGRPIPADWGLNAEGHPTTDPNAIAGLHPIAGPKGSGLAMMIDIFCSVLTGMPWGPNIPRMYEDLDQPRQLGHFVMAIDTQRFMALELFKARLDDMLAAYHDVPPAEGYERLYYPGELEGLRRQERRANGIPIDPGLYAELQELGERLGVEL